MLVEIVDYDPEWPARAEALRSELLAALPGTFTAIEHVGSTSVPGLAAKSIIDLMASVPSLDAVTAKESVLTRLGYRAEDNGMPARLFYWRGPDGGQREVHLHVVTDDTFPTRNERLLRDLLRRDPAAVAEYADLKRRLAAQAGDGFAYTKGKTALVQRLIDRARTEAGLPLVDVWEE